MNKRFHGSTWLVLYVVFLTFVSTVLILFLLLQLFRRLGIFTSFDDMQGAFMITLLLLGLGIGLLMASIFGRRISTPLRELSRATKKVSQGDFTVHVENDDENELGELTRSFNRMVRELGGIETLRKDFVSDVSHEFKTPIAAILGAVSMLEQSSLSEEERADYIRIIHDNASRLNALAGNMLQLAKLENQEIVPNRTTFRLDEQLRNTVLNLEPLWSEKAIDWVIELPNTEITSGEDLLSQVWVNLLSNAIKFSNPGGMISVGIVQTGKGITVSIEDNGIGMQPETVDRIFEKFYQAEVSREKSGTGLGLPLVKRIVELFGGSIHVESEPGEGSLFEVFLPK